MKTVHALLACLGTLWRVALILPLFFFGYVVQGGKGLGKGEHAARSVGAVVTAPYCVPCSAQVSGVSVAQGRFNLIASIFNSSAAACMKPNLQFCAACQVNFSACPSLLQVELSVIARCYEITSRA